MPQLQYWGFWCSVNPYSNGRKIFRPSLVFLQLPPDISRFHSFSLTFEKNELWFVNSFFSKRLEEACFHVFSVFSATKHISPFDIFAVPHRIFTLTNLSFMPGSCRC